MGKARLAATAPALACHHGAVRWFRAGRGRGSRLVADAGGTRSACQLGVVQDIRSDAVPNDAGSGVR